MNKMFKKLMAVTATVAMAASMSVSAFAADVTVAPTNDKLSVTPTAVESATMYTVMVFSCTADANKDTAVPANSDAIYYINQGTDVTALVTNMLVKATTVDDTTSYLPVGNYIVRIGNDKGSVQNFTIESKEETITILYGDVNKNGTVNALDIRDLKRYLAKWDGYDATVLDITAADVNDDGKVNALDIRDLKRYLAKWDGYATLPIKK